MYVACTERREKATCLLSSWFPLATIFQLISLNCNPFLDHRPGTTTVVCCVSVVYVCMYAWSVCFGVEQLHALTT